MKRKRKHRRNANMARLGEFALGGAAVGASLGYIGPTVGGMRQGAIFGAIGGLALGYLLQMQLSPA